MKLLHFGILFVLIKLHYLNLYNTYFYNNFNLFIMNENPQTFSDYEEKERRLLIGLFNIPETEITDYTIEPSGNYSKTDGTYTSKEIKHRFESKVRKFSYSKYPDHFLELPKMLELLKYHREGYETDYIMFFQEPDNTYSAIVYNLSERFRRFKAAQKRIKDVVRDKFLPSYTAGGGSRNYIQKKVLMMKFNPAIDTLILTVPIYEGYISDTTLKNTTETESTSTYTKINTEPFQTTTTNEQQGTKS